jgi:Leucine-rich repeat (LRR) protein
VSALTKPHAPISAIISACLATLKLPHVRRAWTNSDRLALSHNLLTTLPSRLVECRRLRYLNVRYNAMREIPEAVRLPCSSAGATTQV